MEMQGFAFEQEFVNQGCGCFLQRTQVISVTINYTTLSGGVSLLASTLKMVQTWGFASILWQFSIRSLETRVSVWE